VQQGEIALDIGGGLVEVGFQFQVLETALDEGDESAGGDVRGGQPVPGDTSLRGEGEGAVGEAYTVEIG